ncbi:stage V sporulation protein T [Abyssisolibacter fermentans]|uniref:stage V sporulation protein T n=1 Tax=Abyssisolibacter fermentans TaxID=1766203 RepID=UPI00082FE4B9|nr:stage V sporulation protein T [Abyssisolibacter fermentans]
MKATGIVRRIDDLGRVVIPKEIRRTLRIKEGDPLEIFTDREGQVILKKYSPIGELGEFAEEYAEALSQTVKHIAIVCDRDTVVAISGASNKEYYDKRLSTELEKIIESKEIYETAGEIKPIRLILDEASSEQYVTQIIAPVVSQGDPIGAVILASKESGATMGEVEIKLAETAARFLAKQMEG